MIRAVRPEDVKRITEIYSWYVAHTTITYEITLPDEAEMLQRINKITASFPWLVYEENGEVIGYAYAGKFREREAFNIAVELSAYFDQEHCGGGRGMEILQALLKELEGYELYTALACISYGNAASRKLCEKLGFQLAGITHNVGYKFGQWLSLAFYTLQLKEYKEI